LSVNLKQINLKIKTEFASEFNKCLQTAGQQTLQRFVAVQSRGTWFGVPEI
jgi:hypothetical protein